MNDDDRDLADERAAVLLRRAGVVEQDPPRRVREEVLKAVRDVEAQAARPDAPPAARVGGRDRSARRGVGPPSLGWLLAAAAAGALVTWTGLSLTGSQDPGQVLASGELSALAAEAPEGRAEVVDVDGQPRLRVVLDEALEVQDGYLEVWLLRPDVSGMVTVGVLDGPTGEFALPEGIDLEDFAVVDISREHVDGDPGHGGDSLVRGQVG